MNVANSKARWFQWQMALDIPEAANLQIPLRNASVQGEARDQLVVDGGERSIRGVRSTGREYRFEGHFQGTPVYLGELRTDALGRLLFLGGLGHSASPTGAPIFRPEDGNSFINADGWFDDASDGPVSAEVSIAGHPIPVEPAWVVTAPPNYAPDVVTVRTLYDLLFDLYVRSGWLPFPEQVSFLREVHPILRNMSSLQWVNQGFATQFGKGGPHDFEDPELLRKLSWLPLDGGADVFAELRLQVLHHFRDPAGTDSSQRPWPWLYGDAMDVPPANTPRQNASLSATQYRILQDWAAGHFIPDWDPSHEPARELEHVPLAEQPALLDRAALHFCLADAFHPGCEVTWPLRHLSLFSSPFRIRHRPPGVPAPTYDGVLTQALALSEDGPVHAQGPGDLTRWMGLPWQADTAYCRSGYSTTTYSDDPYLPTFWPARVPNQVLTAEAYAVVTDPRRSHQERVSAFTQRSNWVRALKGTVAEQMEQMVATFGQMGVVELRPGLPGDVDFPAVMGVEAKEWTEAPAGPPALTTARTARQGLHEQNVRKAGWGSTRTWPSHP